MTIKDIKDKELYINKAREAEKKYNIPENTLVGLLAQESGHFNKDVISGKKKSYAGAIGIGQFMPKTAQFYKIDPLNVDQAIDASAKYLASSFNTFKNWDDAILSYNAGVGRVKEYKAGKPIKIKEHSEYVGRVKNQINRYGAGKLTNPKENITPELTDFDFTTQTPTFALEDSNVEEEDAPKEDKSKEVTQAKEVLKEEQFMSDMFKGKITPIQTVQEEAPQQAPQSNLLESFANIESFVDTPLAQQGGIIKDNMGQLKYPGKITEISSPNISMKGVNYPVLGISKQTGEQKLMMPNLEYFFKNTQDVVEFPLKK